jgi:hypothetical protein
VKKSLANHWSWRLSAPLHGNSIRLQNQANKGKESMEQIIDLMRGRNGRFCDFRVANKKVVSDIGKLA